MNNIETRIVLSTDTYEFASLSDFVLGNKDWIDGEWNGDFPFIPDSQCTPSNHDRESVIRIEWTNLRPRGESSCVMSSNIGRLTTVLPYVVANSPQAVESIGARIYTHYSHANKTHYSIQNDTFVHVKDIPRFAIKYNATKAYRKSLEFSAAWSFLVVTSLRTFVEFAKFLSRVGGNGIRFHPSGVILSSEHLSGCQNFSIEFDSYFSLATRCGLNLEEVKESIFHQYCLQSKYTHKRPLGIVGEMVETRRPDEPEGSDKRSVTIFIGNTFQSTVFK